MTLKGALSVKFDVKCPADKFFSAFVEDTNRPFEKNGNSFPLFTSTSSLIHHSIHNILDLTLPDCYVSTIGKTEIEAVDLVKKTLTIQMSGSEIQKYFKTLKGSIAVTPIKGGDGSHVVWTFHFEKVHKDIGDPHSIIDESVKYFKKLDEAILNFKE